MRIPNRGKHFFPWKIELSKYTALKQDYDDSSTPPSVHASPGKLARNSGIGNIPFKMKEHILSFSFPLCKKSMLTLYLQINTIIYGHLRHPKKYVSFQLCIIVLFLDITIHSQKTQPRSRHLGLYSIGVAKVQLYSEFTVNSVSANEGILSLN